MDPLVVRNVARFVAQGTVSMVMDEVRGHIKRKQELERPAIAPLADEFHFESSDFSAAPDEYGPLPSLDDAALGETLGQHGRPPLPEDLFAAVVGLQHEKSVLRSCVRSDPPLHAYIVGPPGTAKSLLLDELRRLPETHYAVASTATPAGLRNLVTGPDAPRILLLDELEKTDRATQEALLAIMDGEATKVQAGEEGVDNRKVDVRIIAAGNSLHVSDPLLSRMWILELHPYSPAEKAEVVVVFLQKRMAMSEADAKEIAKLVAPRANADVRDAAQLATVWRTDPTLAREMAARQRS